MAATKRYRGSGVSASRLRMTKRRTLLPAPVTAKKRRAAAKAPLPKVPKLDPKTITATFLRALGRDPVDLKDVQKLTLLLVRAMRQPLELLEKLLLVQQAHFKSKPRRQSTRRKA